MLHTPCCILLFLILVPPVCSWHQSPTANHVRRTDNTINANLKLLALCSWYLCVANLLRMAGSNLLLRLHVYIHQMIFLIKCNMKQKRIWIYFCVLSLVCCAAVHFDSLIKVKTNRYPETGGDGLRAGGTASLFKVQWLLYVPPTVPFLYPPFN